MHSINIRNKNSAAAALKQCKNRLLNELMWLFKKKKKLLKPLLLVQISVNQMIWAAKRDFPKICFNET